MDWSMVYLTEYGARGLARESIERYIGFYNARRGHSSLQDRTPDAAYFGQMELRAAA